MTEFVAPSSKGPTADGAAITGAQLAAEIDRLLASNRGIAKRRVGKLLYGTPNGVEQIRRKGWITQKVVERVRDLCANPPPEVFTPPHKVRPKNPKPKRRRLSTAERGWRISAGIKRANRLKALARIEAGLDARKAGAALMLTQRTIEAMMEQEARGRDPVEQAKTLLRRSGRVVYSMSVHGGPKDKFIISGRGSEPIGTEELLELASRLAA